MLRTRLPLPLVLSAFIVTFSCSAIGHQSNAGESGTANSAGQTQAMPEAGSAKGVTDQQIRKVDFRNFTYEPMCAGEVPEKVTLTNGEFSREKQEDGYVDRFHFQVFDISYGDLNGDNSEEAIVLTTCNTGGTGNFTEGFIFTLKNAKPVLLERIPGGDRAYGGLHKARVENGQLLVEAYDPGEGGANCCPELILTTRYDVSSGKLKQVGKSEKRPLYPTQKVSFPKGSTGTTLKITLPGDEGKRFIVGARAGQTLDVTVNSEKLSLRLLEDAELTNNTNGFSAVLPKNGDYTIEVANIENSPVEITLNIRIR